MNTYDKRLAPHFQCREILFDQELVKIIPVTEMYSNRSLKVKFIKILALLSPLVLFACNQGEDTTLAMETKFLNTSFGRVAVTETGQGRATILFIHGNSASKAVFSKQFESDLADRYRLVAFDLPGHGESDNAKSPQTTYTISSYASLVRELAGKLKLDTVVLAGWSLGGHIAIEAVAQGFPAVGMVFSGTPPVGPGLEHMGEAFIASESMGLTGKPDFTDEEVVVFADQGMGGAAYVTDQVLQAVARTDGIARLTMLQDWSTPGAGFDQRQLVAEWPNPIAVLQGEEDAFINGEYLRALEWNNLWRGQVQFLEGMGHAPFWQDAGQYNELLGSFMTDLGY